VTAKRVDVFSEVHLTILGGALSAMVGSGTYASYEEAARETLHASTVTEPDESTTRGYAEARQRWRELYLEITELTEEGKL
jgi:sugar (pentulose or hexulose) kinase